MELVISIPMLSRTPEWKSARETGAVTVEIGGKPVRLKLVPRPTPVASAFAFECPNPACRARCINVWIDEASGEREVHRKVLGCNRCLRVKRRHPANIQGTTFARAILRPCLQLQGLDRRLAVRGLHPNLRRRLKRRRKRILQRLEAALAERQAQMQSGLDALVQELTTPCPG